MYPYLDNEREWILIHENNSNVAICFVYLAAEVGGDNFHVWTAELCAMLQAEITTLREDGYIFRAGRIPSGTIVLSRERPKQSRTIPSFQKKKNAQNDRSYKFWND